MSLWLIGTVLLLNSAAALAQEESCVDCQDQPVEFEASLRVDNDFNPNEDGLLKYNLRTQKFEGQASIQLFKDVPYKIADEILLVVRSRMEQDVVVNGVLDANHLSVADYLKEAYIEFKRVGGLPIAVIIGASEVSYGQDFSGTIDFQNDSSHAMTDPDQGQIKGFTIVLDDKLTRVFDSVEATIFNSNPDLLKGGFDHLDAFAFRVTKNLSDHLVSEVSVMKKGNGESKLSVGGAFRNGLWTIWGEAVFMKNSEAYPGATRGGTVGVHRITGPGQIDVEATGIASTLKQFAAGYELFVTRHWATGPTFRYTYCAGGNAGCMSARGYGQGPSLGVSARWAFGDSDDENPTWIGKAERATVKKLLKTRDRHKSD